MVQEKLKENNVEKLDTKEKKAALKRQLDEKISRENRKIGLLEQLQNEFDDIGKNVERCIDLLSYAIDGNNSTTLFEDLHNTNRKNLREASKYFENDTANLKVSIEKYYEKRNKLDEE